MGRISCWNNDLIAERVTGCSWDALEEGLGCSELDDPKVEEFKNPTSAGFAGDPPVELGRILEGEVVSVEEVVSSGFLDLSRAFSLIACEICLLTSESFFLICSGDASFLNWSCRCLVKDCGELDPNRSLLIS